MLKKNLFNLFVIFIILLLFSLGSWQLKRLSWKTNLIANISNSFNSSPIKISANIKEFDKIKFNGTIIGEPISVYKLGVNGSYGFDIYYPLLVKDENIMIKAGWSPKIIKEIKGFQNNKYDFEGVVFNFQKKNLFTPENHEKEFYYFINSKVLSKKYNKQFSNFYLHETGNVFKSLNLYKNNNIKIRNNHLQYALTWYSLCFIILVAFIIYRKKNEVRQH